MYINLMDISYNYRIPVTEMSAWQPNSHQWSVMKPSVDGFWLMVGGGHFEKPFSCPNENEIDSCKWSCSAR